MTKPPQRGDERGIVPDFRGTGFTRKIQVHNPAQHRRIVAWKVLDMRGMTPGPAGEQPFLGQVLDEIPARGNLPLRQRAQDIGADEALGRLDGGKAPGAVELRVGALVIAWTIPAPL